MRREFADRAAGERRTEKKARNGKESREAILCPVEKRCGGCQLLGVDYRVQIKRKQKQLEELLGGLCPVRGMIGMENPFHYRHKVHAVFSHDRRGNAISGIYQENTHKVVPVERCLIEDEQADAIIGTIRGMLRSFKIRTYDEDTEYGLLRHVLIRKGYATGEIMVVLVTASPVFPSRNNFVRALREKHPEITTIVLNINKAFTSMVLGDRETVLYGPGYIRDKLCGMTFRISPRSFYQINPVQTQALYTEAIRLCQLTGKETVLDAYCGTGTIGMIASRQAAQVIGVELNPDAVKDAKKNARENKVDNIRFFCADAGDWMRQAAEEGYMPQVVLMDPPRAGCSRAFLQALLETRPERIVYISCMVETQARDLQVLVQGGYRVRHIQPVDMFPHTNHVECIVSMTRK